MVVLLIWGVISFIIGCCGGGKHILNNKAAFWGFAIFGMVPGAIAGESSDVGSIMTFIYAPGTAVLLGLVVAIGDSVRQSFQNRPIKNQTEVSAPAPVPTVSTKIEPPVEKVISTQNGNTQHETVPSVNKETALCPVCKAPNSVNATHCANCSFTELSRTFISTEDASDWFDKVVVPYRQRWQTEQQRKREMSTSASSLYAEMQGAQFSKVTSYVKSEVQLFNYAPFRDGIELTSYNGELSTVSIPEEIDGLMVRKLCDGLFAECKNLYSVHLPANLREIGEKAFYNSSLSRINIPAELQRIGKSAFSRTNITEITFPRDVDHVQESVCSSCQKLQTVVVVGAKKISNYAFSGCYALQQLILPDGLESIGQAAFSNTFPLTKIVVPSSVKRISMDFAKTSSGGVVGGAHAQIKHIAILNDDIEWEYAFGGTYTNYSLQRKYDMMAYYYCNQGSTTQKYTREKQLNMLPLSQFPR